MEGCGGCPYHEFPYRARVPIKGYGSREFTCSEDIWDVIDTLVQEVSFANDEGKEFDVGQSIKAQLPFFCCPNNILDKRLQRDIQRYIYCEQFGISPYRGSYGEQPARWVDKAFVIKKALAEKEKEQIDGEKRRRNNND